MSAGHPIQSGVIPYRVTDQGIEVLLITSRRTGSWSVPKGLIEPGWTPLDAALKEAWEEAGVRGVAAPDPLGSYEHVKRGRTIAVSLYLLRVESVSESWPERRSRKREWLAVEKAAAAVENPGLRDLLASVPAALGPGRSGDARPKEGDGMEFAMKARLTFDTPKVPVDRTVKIRALLRIEAEGPGGDSRRPLNIGVVLDRSGSMQGAKIHSVREATQALADRLGADDLFSLTIFDHIIETIIPPRKMGDGLGALRSAVAAIQARGNTNLCGGYQAGCENVLGKRGNGALDRVVLLTDGLANAGITDPTAIASISRQMAERGIVTSTIGVGADYSEALLGRMAEAGGGNTYFLQGASEVNTVLEEELGGLLSLTAEGLTVRFDPAGDGIKAGQLNAYRVSSDGAWVLGDVYESQPKTLVLELEIPPRPLGKKVLFGTLHLACKATTQGKTTEFTQNLPLDLDVVSEEEFAAQPIDTEVTLHVVELTVASAKVKAWELAARQDFEGAAKALNECAAALEKIGIQHPAITNHIESLRGEARRLGEEKEAYYTPMRQKSMYYEAYYASSSKYSHLASMRARHSGYGASGCHTFPLQEVDGHLIAGIGSGRYLVDTGRPKSIGEGSSIVVGSRSFGVEGADAASLTREIGTPVSGILGADILGQFDVGFDIGSHRLILDENCWALAGRPVVADFRSGVPTLLSRISGESVPLLFSTGTRISLLRADLAASGEVVGRDFAIIAGVGRYETDLRNVEVRLGDATYSIPVGTLPRDLEATLSGNGLAGIIGAPFLRSRRVCMSARQGIVTIGSF
jgi:8-oxo-dGTP pyrophosphatase MutT (NUDIX family)/Mg-chelatase subunit ChlD